MTRTVATALQCECRGGWRAPPAILLLLLAAGASANPEILISRTNGLVSVNAVDATPSAVLDALIAAGLVDESARFVLDEPDVVAADSLTVGRLVRRALRHRSYILLEDGGSHRLLLFNPVAGVTAARGSVSAPDNELLDRIRVQLTDADPQVREQAVLDVVDLDTALAVDLVIPLMQDPDAAVREAASAVLDDLGATDGIDDRRLPE